jgi:DNA polymerase-1
MYPELGLWHGYTAYETSEKVPEHAAKLYNKFSGNVEAPLYGARIYRPTTLMGREFAVLADNPRQALSYQGQGSGCDMIVLAISRMPADLLEHLLLAVHDELVLEVPDTMVDWAKESLTRVMSKAGEIVLDGLVPIIVEAKSGQRWAK